MNKEEIKSSFDDFLLKDEEGGIQTEDNSYFIVDSNIKAENKLCRIKMKSDDLAEYESTAKALIEDYTDKVALWLEKETTPIKNDIELNKQLVLDYFQNNPDYANKNLKLPSGSIMRKKINGLYSIKVKDTTELINILDDVGIKDKIVKNVGVDKISKADLDEVLELKDGVPYIKDRDVSKYIGYRQPTTDILIKIKTIKGE